MLRNETCFRFNRSYLLATLLLSFILPLLSFTISIDGTATIDPNAFILPEIIITDTALADVNQHFGILSILNISYLVITLLFIVRLIVRLFNLWRIVNENRHLRKNKYVYEVIPTQGKLPTSSFLNYLFWDNTSTVSEIEEHQIIAHEKVHIIEHHTYDILLIECISIVCWFNPFIWLWKKEVTDNHEYLADARASLGTDGYAELLARHTLALNGFPVIHPFKSAEVIKRLQMLKKYGQRTKLVKLLAVIPLLLFMFFTMSFSVNEILDVPVNYDNPTIDNSFTSIDFNEPIKNTTYDNQIKPAVNVQHNYIIPETIAPKPVGILGKFDTHLPPLVKEDEVFTLVEDSAEPLNGMTAFYKYVARTMKYPKQARKLGIEGRVFVEFIVDQDGNLTEVKAVKGIGAGCDAEAVRTIINGPAWKPGKQRGKTVKQKIVLPITFQLG
jgi:TonB family protein